MTSNSQSTKSLGQVANDGYHDAVADGAKSYDAWQAAAEAVAEELGVKRETLQECAAAEAVIEAAKALVDPDQCRGWFSLYTRLEHAIKALQEVEGE